MADLKPIETRYKGYRFRSRLEARWAVFFDALGIKWEYEKEGYDLGEAGWYLPDFWLPKLTTWVEIKQDYNTMTEDSRIDAHRKARALRDCSGGTSVVVVFGPPGNMQSWAYFMDCSDSGGGYHEEWGGAFCFCDKCGAWFDYYNGLPGSHTAMSSDWEPLYACDCPLMQRTDEPGLKCYDQPVRSWIECCVLATSDAVRKARSARFEHGERG